MHGHIHLCVDSIAFKDGLQYFFMVKNGVAFLLDIQGKLDILMNGGK